MSIQVNEIPESERTRTQDGVPSGERRFLAYDDGIAPIQKPFNQTGPLHHPNMPRRGDIHPRNVNLRATDYSIRAVGDKTSYVFEYTWIYERSDIDFGDTDDPDEPDITEFVEFSIAWTTFFVDGWRVRDHPQSSADALTFPPQGLINHENNTNSSATDIGGDPIDAGGEPVSIPVYQQELTIKHFVTSANIFAPIRNAIGKRNDGEWYGAPLGSLLYKGANSVRVGQNLYEITHIILWDNFYHTRQVCWRDDTDGKYQTGKALGLASTSIYYDKGFPVHWVQPYNELIDFDSLQIPPVL